MILTCLFRVLETSPSSLQFSPRINITAGPTGQGKTNLLEAIHVLALSRSFRTLTSLVT